MTAPHTRRGWTKRRWTVLLGFPVVLMFFIFVGNFVPIPFVDALSAFMTTLFVWTTLAAIVVALAAVFLWRRRRSLPRTILLGVACLTVVGALVVSVRTVVFAVAQDVPINVAQVLFGVHADSTPDDVLDYTEVDGDPLTMAVWSPAAGAQSGAPVIVMVHGGGYVSGDTTDRTFAAHAQWFADRGYLVFGANYTLATEDQPTWNVAEGEIACALAWVGENAAEYGGDVSKLGLFGDSAGGNLVVNTAYKTASGELDSSCGGEVPTVSAVSGLYPAVDATSGWDNPNLLGVVGRMMSELYLEGSPQDFPASYESVDAINAISESAPPTLVVYGERDHLVPATGTAAFVRAAAEAGIPTKEIAVPYADHGFDVLNLGGIGSQVWRESTLQWFEDNGIR